MAIIALTDKCNLSCASCFRPRRADRARKEWSSAELEGCLESLAAIGQSFVAYTGGEPGLWADGSFGLVDLLAATAQRQLSPMLITNGYPFINATSAAVLLDRYFDLVATPLEVCLSIDYWHEGAWQDGRSPALDAILDWRDAQREPPMLKLSIVSIWCLEDRYNLRPEEFARYTEASVMLQYLPLSSLSSPAALDHLAPKLCPSGRDKQTLGSFEEIVRQRLGLTTEEWSSLDNWQLVGPCQAVDILTLDLDGNWWLCNERAGAAMRVASAGELTAEAVAGCLSRNPLVASFRRNGFLGALHQSECGRGSFDAATVASLLKQAHSYGKSGRAACGVCRALPESAFT